ncbi:extracellular solute-binding protein [Blumeria hordei DH14]|uniref:Extracellular solute-binding protein n=1 Tax=Blumeria graminis f. sp. hordei (strain DH14) TaxID=546991 RepID=N1JK31_BLUG1|nr:extracellular solute-binding protein [Blumeria hordei DH14]
MMSSSRTACDLVFEDTFILESDVSAGYLRPIDEYLTGWDDWKKYYAVTREAVRAEDGKTYAVPIATDTRAIWYHSGVLEKAGISLPWQPKNWDELLEAARTIKRKLPGVVPLNVYASKASGEKTSMQGFEMLLYGTDSTLYDDEAKKWVVGSKGFRDSLQFIRTLYREKLGPPLSSALDPNLAETVQNGWFRKGTIAMMIDGSWISRAWGEDGPGSWPDATKVVKLATMPTQRGQGKGLVTLAGGHSWAFPKKASSHDLAFEFARLLSTRDNLAEVTTNDRNVTTRTDIAELKEYRESTPFQPFFTNLVKDATYRPALAPYPQISTAIQVACEQVMTGSRSPDQAAEAYDNAVIGIVGRDQTMREA